MSRPIPFACFPRRLCPLTRAVTVCWSGVRYFVGLRTTDHPLFQVDKLLIKAQKSLPDDVDFETWIDSVEGLNSHIAKINEAPAGPSTCTCPACAAGMWRSRYTRVPDGGRSLTGRHPDAP